MSACVRSRGVGDGVASIWASTITMGGLGVDDRRILKNL